METVAFGRDKNIMAYAEFKPLRIAIPLKIICIKAYCDKGIFFRGTPTETEETDKSNMQ